MDKTCQQCGKAFQTRKKERKYCSKACYGAANRAENSVHWKGENLTNTCEVCGKTFRCGSTKVAKKRKYCSPECHGKVNTSSNNPTWKGGYTTKTGYHTIRIEGKLQYTHRMIIENHLGRPLKDNEVVHHINGDPSDNRIENLELITQGEHMKRHSKFYRSNAYKECTQCRKVKHRSRFSKVNKKTPTTDSHKSWCKDCCAKKAKERRLKKTAKSQDVNGLSYLINGFHSSDQSLTSPVNFSNTQRVQTAGTPTSSGK